MLLYCLLSAGGITVVATKEANGYSVLVEAQEPRGMVLHWGINEWEAPPQDQLPEGSNKVRAGVVCA
jgi:hypothetical protein